jgi:sugar/nucleoside kinase (ribokinase family)
MLSIEEAHVLTGLTDLNASAQFFLDGGVRPLLRLCTRRRRRVYHHANGTKFKIPAFDIDVKHTCGCRDAFDGILSCAML